MRNSCRSCMIRVQVSTLTSGGLQLPVTLAPGCLMPSGGVDIHQHTCAHKHVKKPPFSVFRKTAYEKEPFYLTKTPMLLSAPNKGRHTFQAPFTASWMISCLACPGCQSEQNSWQALCHFSSFPKPLGLSFHLAQTITVLSKRGPMLLLLLLAQGTIFNPLQ